LCDCAPDSSGLPDDNFVLVEFADSGGKAKVFHHSLNQACVSVSHALCPDGVWASDALS
jgi:hypothetical protein